MKIIYLAKGKGEVKVDDADYEMLSQYKWHLKETSTDNTRHRYAATSLYVEGKKKTVRMHRFLLKAPDGVLVDHKDGDGLNNQRDNLRFCTHCQNCHNSKPVSGYKGVYYSNSYGCWAAEIRSNYKRYALSYFILEEDAARCYDIAASILHGEFAKLNFPDMDYSSFIEQAKTRELKDVVREERKRLNRRRKTHGARRRVAGRTGQS